MDWWFVRHGRYQFRWITIFHLRFSNRFLSALSARWRWGAGDFHEGQKSRKRQKHADENLAAPKTRRHKNTPYKNHAEIHYHADHKRAKTKSHNSKIPPLPKLRRPKIVKSRRNLARFVLMKGNESEEGNRGPFCNLVSRQYLVFFFFPFLKWTLDSYGS